MLGYILRRIASTVPVMLIVAALVFLMLRLTPGDPAAIIAGDNANADQIAAIRSRLGLDAPLILQFFHWLGNLLRGDFGESFYLQEDRGRPDHQPARADAGAIDLDHRARGGDRGPARRARRLQARHDDRQGRHGLFGARLLGAGVRDRLLADLSASPSSSTGCRCRAISASATALAASCSG